MSAGMARAWKKFVYLSLGTKVIGYNPIGKIHQAAKNCELKRIERYLGRGCHVDDTDQKNRTPLHYACAYGNPAVVTLLVKRKCNVDLCDSDGNTPLMKALQYEEEECAILLLEHGANPNVHNNKGETPLHCAIFYRSTSVATKLLSFNADIEARNTSGQTPLLFAIKKKRQMMVEFFINNKANIHAVDDKGRTALMFAVEHKSTQIAELLLQCGVNVSASDKCGRIALSYAIASGSTANRNLILQYMKAESRTSAIFSSVKESSEADALIRSPEKSDPGDSCIAKGEGNYEAHIKNILEEGGKLTKASRQSTKDEAKYDTGSRRSENLPDSSTPASQKKEVVETTLVQEIRIKNYSPFFPSPDSKPKQANTGCRVLNVEKFHPCLPGSVIGPFSYEEIVSQIPQNDVGHLPGDAHQTAKDDVNGHIEATSHGVDHGASEGTATHGLTPRTAPMDVVPMSSQMSESSSFQFVRAEDTVKEDTPLSCMAFQDFTHCFVKPILDRRCFLQKNIVRRTEERLCKSDKPLWFSSSEEEEEEEEGLDDTQNKQPQILSEAHPQMLISQSSGKKHYRAKEKADGHDHDMGSICSHSRGSRKSHPVTPENAGEEDAQEEPASYRASWDTTECTKHTERPVTVKEPDPCPGPGKAEAETVRSAENLFDVTSEEEQESSDDTLHNQPQILSEALLQMQLSHSSGEKQHRAKEETDGHDRDMGPICSHSRGSRKSNPVSPENAEEVAQEEPASYRASWDTTECTKHTERPVTVKEPDPCPGPGKAEAETVRSASWDTTECTKHTERPVTVKEPDPCPGPGKAEAETVRSAENLVDVTSEEEQESSDDTLHNQPQIISEALLQMQLSHSSGEKQHRAKEETDGHDRDMGPICSHSRGSRKSNPVTPENAGEEDAQEEPASYRASRDASACTKHTERPITVKEPDPCPGPGKAEAETVRSAENLFDVTSEEEQESSDDTLHNQPQIISEALLQMQLSHSSGEKQHRAKEETDGHDRDMGPICSHSRGSRKSNPVTPENAGEEDAQEEPASYRASRDASACTKHTERPVTVKEPDPCPGPGKAEAETVRSAENLVDVTSEEEQESSDDTLHNQPQIFSEAHPQMQISLSSGKKHHRAKEKADGHDRDSVILLKTQKDVLRFQRKMKPKKHHCSQCSLHLKRNAQLENENFEVKKVLSEFQQENAELKQQLHDLRCALKEEAKRRNDELLREKHKDQLKEKEAEYNKEDKVRKQAEISVDTLGTKLRTARNHFDQIPTRDESDNKPLHKNHKTKDEISMRRLRTDPIKYQNQEKKCLKNTEILTEKDVDLPKTVKLNEKTLAKTFQDNEQLDIWKAERTLQNCTPESEKQRTERPETKVTSHPARPSAAPHHQGDSPTPKRNLELAFQRARDKDFSSQEEKNIDVINLEVSSEIPSQQAPKSKIQTSDLENELRKTRGTLRVMTLATQQVNRQLKQRQCQLKGMEHGHQNEQRKRNAQLRKQEASREKVSKLQSETALLQDQLHDYQNKANDKKDEIINIQSQFQDIIKRIQAQNDKHYLMLENEYMELTSETNHLKEQLDHYGKEKEVVVVRHLEKQPAGILKLPSASPEDLPHFHTNLKDKRRDLKKTLRHMTSQINDLTTKMDSASSKHLRLEANYQCFLQNLFSLKSIQDRFETIDKNQKKLEEDVVNFPRHTQGTRVEGGTEQTARCDLDEKQKQTQAAAPEVSEQLRQTGSASIKTQMELRISNLESELKTKKYN
ncbi:uncharacterized protein LOC110597004 isoform X13 [Ictidomys tridecemlineatus]